MFEKFGLANLASNEGNVNKTELNSVDLITFTTLPIKRQLKHHKNTKIKTNRCTHFRKGKKSKGAWLRRFRKKMAGLHTSSMRRDISHFEYFRIETKTRDNFNQCVKV